MGKKREINKSYGEKLIKVFVKLLFSGERHSLTELSNVLQCSKQTVIRLIDDIEKGYGVNIELSQVGNRHYYRIKRPVIPIPMAAISEREIAVLQMCRDFTAQLIGKQLFEEATTAILKSQALVPGKNGESSDKYFATIRPGTIDYTPHNETISTVIDAMKQKRICQVNYQSIMENRPKAFGIIPMKLFSYKDTLYLHARLANRAGKEFKSPDYDPLLALHRIKKIAITDRRYESSEKYDFDEIFNKHFGIIKDRSFKLEIEFRGWAARYVSERVWSPSQKISKQTQGRINLEFTSSSVPEIISWVLSFGEEAKIIRPASLIKAINYRINMMATNYGFTVHKC